MATKVKSFRLPSELLDKLDEVAQRTGVKRNAVLRYILYRAFDTPEIEARMREELVALRHEIAKRMRLVHECLRELVIDDIVDALPAPEGRTNGRKRRLSSGRPKADDDAATDDV